MPALKLVDKALEVFRQENTRTRVWKANVLRDVEAFYNSPEKYMCSLLSALVLDFGQVANDGQLRTFVRQWFTPWFRALTEDMARMQLGDRFIDTTQLRAFFHKPADLETRWVGSLQRDQSLRKTRLLHFSDLPYVTDSSDLQGRWSEHMSGHSVVRDELPKLTVVSDED